MPAPRLPSNKNKTSRHVPSIAHCGKGWARRDLSRKKPRFTTPLLFVFVLWGMPAYPFFMLDQLPNIRLQLRRNMQHVRELKACDGLCYGSTTAELVFQPLRLCTIRISRSRRSEKLSSVLAKGSPIKDASTETSRIPNWKTWQYAALYEIKPWYVCIRRLTMLVSI